MQRHPFPFSGHISLRLRVWGVEICLVGPCLSLPWAPLSYIWASSPAPGSADHPFIEDPASPQWPSLCSKPCPAQRPVFPSQTALSLLFSALRPLWLPLASSRFSHFIQKYAWPHCWVQAHTSGVQGPVSARVYTRSSGAALWPICRFAGSRSTWAAQRSAEKSCFSQDKEKGERTEGCGTRWAFSRSPGRNAK